MPLSASECAQLKAVYPSQASNPQLCVVTNTVEWTDLQSAAGISTQMLGISPDLVIGSGGCPSGNVGYYADYNHSPFFELEMWVTVAYAGDCSVPTVVSGSDHGQRDFCYFVYCQDEAMGHWIFGSSLEVQHGINECTSPGFICEWVYQQFEFHTDATDKYWTV